MGTNVVTDEGEFEITKDCFTESMERLESLLESGIPVMAEQRSWNSLHISRGDIERCLFFSDGKIRDGNRFFSRNGQGNGALAMCHGEDNQFQSYKLITYERTFSPAGSVGWEFCHGGCISLVIVGKKVEERFPEALDAVRFVERGLVFELNPFYSMPGYLINTIGLNNEENDAREKESSKLVSISAVRGLARQASRRLFERGEIDKPYNTLHATQLGWWRTGSKHYKESGYPVNDRDYLLYELSHPNRHVAFVKVGEGLSYGNIFVLPYEGAEITMNLALSKDFVKEYFPFEIKNNISILV